MVKKFIQKNDVYELKTGETIYHGTAWEISTPSYFLQLEKIGMIPVVYVVEDEYVAENHALNTVYRGLKYRRNKEIMQIPIVMKGVIEKTLRLMDFTYDWDFIYKGVQYSYYNWFEFQREIIKEYKERDTSIEIEPINLHKSVISNYIDHSKFDGVYAINSDTNIRKGNLIRYVEIMLFEPKNVMMFEYKFYNEEREKFSIFMNEEQVLNFFYSLHKNYERGY